MDSSLESASRPSAERLRARGRRSADQVEAPSTAVGSSPDHELIARRAYQLFEERGGGDGHDVEDWLQAEREVVEPTREAGMLTREINEPPSN